MDNELKERIRQHFTKGELVEFLPISLSDLIDLCEDSIMDNYSDVVDEIWFEFDDDTV